MITFETSITLTISLFVGYISIIVPLWNSNKEKKNKYFLYITILFLLCLIVVWILHFLDYFTPIFTAIISAIQQIINVITPIKGRCFSWEHYTVGYLIGLAILVLPIVVIIYFFVRDEEPSRLELFGLIGGLLFIIIIFLWFEYCLSLLIYRAFIEFSFVHFYIFNVILNILITVAVVFIVLVILDEI